MIERCLYCGEDHEVETAEIFGGIMKTCPNHPIDNPPITFIDLSSFEKVLNKNGQKAPKTRENTFEC